jgi:thymidine kinase
VIGLDEAQFYPDIDKAIEWVYSGKIVFISSLDGDYKRRPFEEVLKLISEADTVTKCYAYCRPCLDKGIYTPAPFSKRIVQSEERIVIGGIDSYIPVCRRCL